MFGPWTRKTKQNLFKEAVHFKKIIKINFPFITEHRSPKFPRSPTFPKLSSFSKSREAFSEAMKIMSLL